MLRKVSSLRYVSLLVKKTNVSFSIIKQKKNTTNFDAVKMLTIKFIVAQISSDLGHSARLYHCVR